MKISDRGLALIKNFEAFSSVEYICPAGKRTIGYGHVVLPEENFHGTVSEEYASALLRWDLEPIEKYLTKAFPMLKQWEFDALCSFCLNVGLGAFKKSTMHRFLVRGDVKLAANEFPRWNKSNGVVLAGLSRRRKAEQAYFLLESTT